MSLQITVKSAANLPNIERFSKSDPMTVLIFQGSKKKTKVIDNNLNPEWNETFEWPLQTAPSSSEQVQVEVFDHETVGKNRLLGRTQISLGQVISKGQASLNLTLTGKKGDKLEATIALDVVYTAPQGAGGGGGGGGGGAGGGDGGDADFDEEGDVPEEGGEEEGGEGGEEGGEEAAAVTALDPSSVSLGATAARKKARQRKAARASLPDKEMDWQIRIHIIEGRKLQGAGINPVVKIAVGTQLQATSSRKGTQNPFFDEMLYYNLTERPKQMFDKVVEVKVLNAKVLLSDCLIGSFKFDLGMVYDELDHCFIHKWLLLTDPEDPSAGAKGYLKISINVIGPGADPKPSPSILSQDDVDIESNLLRPAGVRLQSGTMTIRIYRAEDLPQMDPELMQNVKKFFHVGTVYKELVDAYCVINFAGIKGKTRTIEHEQDPEWNQQLNLSVKFPSMCERIRFQIKDWDRLSRDDYIGTCFLSISDISAPGDQGFLPTFGPCFINLYGSPREFTDLADKYEYLNKGEMEGVAYRGRVMVEVSMEIGKLPTTRKEDIKIVDINRLTPFLRRRKYKLFAAFFSATMVRPDDDPVEFEVSIGNYGNKLDKYAPAQSSTTPPTNPVYDGNNYYFLPWMLEKPCVVVDSQWEDNTYRIESLNILLSIANQLDERLKQVYAMQAHEKYDHNVARDILLEGIHEMMREIKKGLPELPTAGFTHLDRLKRASRMEELGLMLGEANELLLQPNPTLKPVQDLAEEFHVRLTNLAVEPQNSVPDVIIWMLSGNDRVACRRISAHQLMYSASERGRGQMCGLVQDIMLKLPAVEKDEDLEKKKPAGALVRVLLWLGLAEHQSEWARAAPGGEVAVLAETYQNQACFLGKWGTTGLGTRPGWSDTRGKIRIEKSHFIAPAGWEWDNPSDEQGWEIKPELSVAFEPDEGLNEWQQDAFEQQTRRSFQGWPDQMSKSSWFDSHGDYIKSNDKKVEVTEDTMNSLMDPPEGWAWSTEWQLDTNRACDEDGWEYCNDPEVSPWQAFEKNTHYCRRRRWVRTRLRVMDSAAIEKKMAKRRELMKEGWEYAKTWSSSFHCTECTLDLVRRRRWMRKLIAIDPGKPPIFYFKSKKEKKKKKKRSDSDDSDSDDEGGQQAPRMFLAFKEPHKFQLRVYLYQAREMYASDKNGLSDPYAIVSFGRFSQTSRVVKESICPTWDQTLIFDGIRLFGDLKTVKNFPPQIVIELYDKDQVGENEFLGIVLAKPVVRLQKKPPNEPGTELDWFPIDRYNQYAGDMLAAFELLLDEGTFELPFDPPVAPEPHKYFTVPSGIRPVLQRTRIEVLCWGVREMKRFQLLQVTSPLVELECGSHVARTKKHIPNTKINPNFPEPIVVMDCLLPKEEKYAPPFNIRVLDKRSFGREPTVGVHVIKSLDDFHVDPSPGASIKKSMVVVPEEEKKAEDVAVVIEGKTEEALDTDPDNQKTVKYDWWSKYYYSIDDELRKQKEYEQEGRDRMMVYNGELEDAFSDFSDLATNFSLFRGKGKRDPDDPKGQVVGIFKGALKVYPLPDDGSPDPPKVLTNLPSTKPVNVLVRVYIIRGIELAPQDPNGKSDPYLKVKLGKKEISDKENYVPNNLNPLFGKMFELPATLPIDHKLCIKVMDYDRLSADDLIGETTIDLENRFLSNHRPRCGIPNTFCKRGTNKWRDYQLPKQILSWYCKTERLPEPVWMGNEEVMFEGQSFTIKQFEEGLTLPTEDLGPPDQRLALHILKQKGMVPEHVEKRTLYNPMQPNISQGALHMWVDIFPKSATIPPPVDISPRKPDNYFLRIVVWNTKDVILDETSVATGEQMSDIYLKAWLRGEDKTQKTDVHYRSMDGEGNFNWRFVFPFKYLTAEQVMVISKKEHFYSLDKTELHLPPRLTVQIWDNDLFNPDDFLGTLDINLTRMPDARKTAEECDLDQLLDDGDVELTGDSPPRKKSVLNLFEKKRVKGWWPAAGEDEEGKRILAGKMELEFEIVTEEEEQLRPAGQAREEPNMNPHLDDPQRPATSFLWFTSPLKTFKHIIWKYYKWHIILGILLVLAILVIVIMVYTAPSTFMQVIVESVLPF